MSLYDDIGNEFIVRAVQEFYERAVVDPLIGQFFFKIKIADLISKQINFTARLLGRKDATPSEARALKTVHHALNINAVHFARRQKLMATVLADLGLPADQRKAWLKLEAQLKPLIVKGSESCQD